jgi:hypothetical protein
LCCRQWLFFITLDAGLATTPALLPEIARRFRAMTPFAEFLNRPLLAGRRPAMFDATRAPVRS